MSEKEKHEDNKTLELLGKYDAAQKEIEELKAQIQQYQDKEKDIEAKTAMSEKYKTYLMDQLKSQHEKQPDYIKEFISLEEYENDPLSGISAISQFQKFADHVYQERSGNEKPVEDPSNKPVEHEQTATPHSFKEAVAMFMNQNND